MPHPLALKHPHQCPKFDTEPSKYELNYWGHNWGNVSTFMTTSHTEDYTSALLLWTQGTTRTKLGDAFQRIPRFAKSGCSTLSEVGLDGLTELLPKWCWAKQVRAT